MQLYDFFYRNKRITSINYFNVTPLFQISRSHLLQRALAEVRTRSYVTLMLENKKYILKASTKLIRVEATGLWKLTYFI